MSHAKKLRNCTYSYKEICTVPVAADLTNYYNGFLLNFMGATQVGTIMKQIDYRVLSISQCRSDVVIGILIPLSLACQSCPRYSHIIT
ncbi:hypothetical protein J6590_008326 [Homalodisca vitripennis]|nr:hypothetical protein J6590_008326 [Homalodisca vitripennis]